MLSLRLCGLLSFSDVMTLRSWIFLAGLCTGIANQPPNIVLILADDLGWNDISLHGSPQIPTPNLDQLAREGVILDNYYVMHLCSPSRGSLLTGRHAMQLGLQRFVILETQPFGLGLNETILPQYLKPMGYATHLVGKWHQGFFAKELTPLYRGFDTFYGYYSSHESYYDHRCYCDSGYYQAEGYDFRDGDDLDLSANGTYSTYLFTQRAEQLIQAHDKSKPMFLYLAHQAVHSGYGSTQKGSTYEELEAPQEYIDKFSYISDEGRRRFAAMTYLLDQSIGNVTRALGERGMLENTVIIFSTDNGGPPHSMSFNHANNWPLRGAKATYWEGGVRGNAFVWSPLIQKPSRVMRDLMHITDWLPTILHLANGKAVPVGNLYGKDMWMTISEGQLSPREEVVINWDQGSGAIIKGNYKLQVLGDDDMVNMASDWYLPESIDVTKINFTVICGEINPLLPPCERESPCLYNLLVDPCELNNIASQNASLVKDLWNSLMEFASHAQRARNCPDLDWSNPVYHGRAWVPYIHLDKNDTTHDRMC